MHHNKNEVKKIISFKQDRRTLWIIKVMYMQSKGMSMVHWIIWKLYAIKLKRWESYMPLSLFWDRQAHILAYGGNVCNHKGSPMVYWILGRRSRDRKDIGLLRKLCQTDRQTDRPANQPTNQPTDMKFHFQSCMQNLKFLIQGMRKL